MIARKIAEAIQNSIAFYPIIALTGPRQSGKTTRLNTCFPATDMSLWKIQTTLHLPKTTRMAFYRSMIKWSFSMKCNVCLPYFLICKPLLMLPKSWGSLCFQLLKLFKNLDEFEKKSGGKVNQKILVYGGAQTQNRTHHLVCAWNDVKINFSESPKQ